MAQLKRRPAPRVLISRRGKLVRSAQSQATIDALVAAGGGTLASFFNSLTDPSVAADLARAIRFRNRFLLRSLLGPRCSFFFFRTFRFWCVRITCFYGTFNRVRITFTICIRRGFY